MFERREGEGGEVGNKGHRCHGALTPFGVADGWWIGLLVVVLGVIVCPIRILCAFVLILVFVFHFRFLLQTPLGTVS